MFRQKNIYYIDIMSITPATVDLSLAEREGCEGSPSSLVKDAYLAEAASHLNPYHSVKGVKGVKGVFGAKISFKVAERPAQRAGRSATFLTLCEERSEESSNKTAKNPLIWSLF